MTILIPKEMCKIFRISRKTLSNWMHERKLPYIQITKRGRLLFSIDSVAKWVKENNRLNSNTIKIMSLRDKFQLDYFLCGRPEININNYQKKKLQVKF